MIITLSKASQNYSGVVFDIIRIFLPQLTWQELIGDKIDQTNLLEIKISAVAIQIELKNKGKINEPILNNDPNEIKRTIKLGVYKLLKNVLHHPGSPWGILTGIRPTKIIHRLRDQGYNEQEIEAILQKKYEVSLDKIKNLITITRIQRPYLLSSEEALKKVSIYISIPFCPTRCHYCSFPAFSTEQWGNEIYHYLEGLEREIKEVGIALTQQGVKVETIYVGGGTPTILNNVDLKKLLEIINTFLRSQETVEVTVEAGRPDTLDEEKLQLLKKMGIERISINPQTMWEATLKKIGRSHTVQDILNKMTLARKVGFKIINMDLIIGLPGENLEIFRYTLKKIKQLKPENITFHTLAFKRSAKLNQNKDHFSFSPQVEEMFKLAEKFAKQEGYQPYYLYRQKQILANLENIGYSLPEQACLYNIQMMEERQTIWGLGVGAGSKIINPQDWTLENSYNPKDLLIYNQRIKEIIRTKVDKIKGLG